MATTLYSIPYSPWSMRARWALDHHRIPHRSREWVPLLTEPVLRQIVELQLKKIGARLRQNHKATFEYDPSVVTAIAARCTEVESGARNVDHILTGTLLPAVSRELLTRMAEGRPVGRVRVGVDDKGEFTYAFE